MVVLVVLSGRAFADPVQLADLLLVAIRGAPGLPFYAVVHAPGPAKHC
jgi:hypothetical protein